MTEIEARIQSHLDRVRETGQSVCDALQSQLRQLGLDAAQVAPLEAAAFELTRDPANGEESLQGTWRDPRGRRLGSIVFNVEGSFYAEYDVVRPHPTDPRWFIEAVVAWGREDVVKSELRMLRTPGT